MGRFVKEVQLDKSLDIVSIVMEDYFYHNSFTRSYWNDEMVYCYKDSYGKERYMKWSYTCGLFHLEAWLKNSFGGEMDLNGVGGGASRKEYLESIERLLVTLQQGDTDYANGHMNSDPIHHEDNPGDNHKTWKKDTSWQNPFFGEKNSDAEENNSYVIAFLAMGIGLFSPLIGIILSVIALNKGKGTENYRKIKMVAIMAILLALIVAFIGNIPFLLAFLSGV
ncbi:MAG: hypothetical protein ACI4HQ_02825 [Acetatifactor sp.]